MTQPRNLPTGTVTFLFTDIEGSTRLLRDLGDRYAQLLADQQEILRKLVREGGGEEVDSQGEGMFIVFRRAHDAVSTAVACQRAMAAHAWPDGRSVRIRMGLHTGEPERTESGLRRHRRPPRGANLRGGTRRSDLALADHARAARE